MTPEESYMLGRLRDVARRYLSILEAPPAVLVLREDGTFEPAKDRDKAWKRAAQAEALFNNYRFLLEGAGPGRGSMWWHMTVPRGQKLYLTGKAKPSLTVPSAVS